MFQFKRLSQKVLDERILPDYAVLYFDHLISEYNYLLKNNTSSAGNNSEYIKNLNEKRDKKDLSWNDLFSLELSISRILPSERLPREVWSLRSRYRDVVGLTQYEAYLASKPPDLTPEKVNENVFRADIEYLLTEIYLRYLTTPYNEDLRNRISQKVTIMILIGIIIIIISAVSYNILLTGQTDSLGPITLLLVLFIGAMGGLLSMQQRYQSVSREGDPIDNISLLRQGWSRLFMPAINGAIFAALLYMIIIGGLISGKLFPEIKISTNQYILDAIRFSRPLSVVDYAKLVVWSFVAGFAERFVPDTLSRFISTRETSAKGAA